MALHFSLDEYQNRIDKTLRKMKERNLDALLMFRQESMYYLTGYDSFGYAFFQCLILKNNGDLCLLTRSPDLRQAQLTSIIKDIRIWVDGDQHPVNDLKQILASLHCEKKHLGVEYDAYGLNAINGKRLDAALENFCHLQEASLLVSELRAIKSAQEIEYTRKAAQLTDAALEKAYTIIAPGAFEGDILATLQGTIFSGGGEYSGNEFIIGSGENALLCRSFSGKRKLSPQDQLTLEFAGSYMRYHAALMRTVPIGNISPLQKQMYQVCLEALEACQEALKPNYPIGDVFDAYAKTCDRAHMNEHRFNATGYSLGTTFSPTWMDWPMFYHGNRFIAEPGMVFFIHIILMNSAAGIAMSLGRTYLVTATGCEALSKLPLDLITK